MLFWLNLSLSHHRFLTRRRHTLPLLLPSPLLSHPGFIHSLFDLTYVSFQEHTVSVISLPIHSETTGLSYSPIRHDPHTMITRQLFSLALGLVAALPATMAQKAGSIVEVGNTTVSAMMVRFLLVLFLVISAVSRSSHLTPSFIIL